jgi:cyclic pyranopterin phosphate synthase
MPEEGLNFSHKSKLLSYEEMERLVRILAEMGISKVRITGGEPFVRKDIIKFIETLTTIPGIDAVSITTNGTYLIPHIPKLKELGIHSVNLSLDSLDKERFHQITRRDEFDEVMDSYHALIKAGVRTKINMVVMEEHNLSDIIPMCELTREDPVSIRFIEEMPFNGGSKGYVPIKWNMRRIHEEIIQHFGALEKVNDHMSSTSVNYQIPGAKGNIGIIPAYTRTICGQCDRIRLTPKGELKTCLYDNGVFSFRDFMRSGVSDKEIQKKFLHFFKRRAKDGFEAEQNKKSSSSFESMATIGG